MKSQLLMDASGNLCMQLIIGQFTATLPIPIEIVKCDDPERTRKFYEMATKTMTAELERKQAKHDKKQKGSDAVPVPVIRPRAWQKPRLDSDADDRGADERAASAPDGPERVP